MPPPRLGRWYPLDEVVERAELRLRDLDVEIRLCRLRGYFSRWYLAPEVEGEVCTGLEYLTEVDPDIDDSELLRVKDPTWIGGGGLEGRMMR